MISCRDGEGGHGLASRPDAVFIFGGAASPDFRMNVIVDGKTVSYDLDRKLFLALLAQGFAALHHHESGLP